MDHQHREYRSWSYDNSVPPPLPYQYHDGGSLNHGTEYDHHRRYQNDYQDEPIDSFGYASRNAFGARKRQFSHHGPPEYMDGVSYAKLYVRGVPREVTEQDIHSVFGKHGSIIEVVLFKGIKNLEQQECCFVKYAKTEDAAQAIRELHNQYTFPGGTHPIEVKYASKKQKRPGHFMGHECEVFVGFLNKHASKLEIAQIFTPYGYVEDVFLLLDEQKQYRGTGIISFSHKDMAVAAINALNGKYVMNGCDHPLLVRLAGPKKPKAGENRSPMYVNDPVGKTSQPNNSSHMCLQTGSEAPSVSSGMVDLPDCDWSEHICPDGNMYYYNCVTCESRWEKPQELRLYEQRIESCCNRQSDNNM